MGILCSGHSLRVEHAHHTMALTKALLMKSLAVCVDVCAPSSVSPAEGGACWELGVQLSLWRGQDQRTLL